MPAFQQSNIALLSKHCFVFRPERDDIAGDVAVIHSLLSHKWVRNDTCRPPGA